MSEPLFQPLCRWGTHSAKWDLLAAPLGKDTISLSVADMEILSAPVVVDAIVRAAQHGTYGYTEIFDDYRTAAADWVHSRHGWEVPAQCVRFFPRIVQAVSALCCHILPAQLGRPPVVVTLDPAYGPIVEVVERSGARLRRVPVRMMADAAARLDLDALASAMEGADLLLWCNPHNPTGRVWSEEELQAVGHLALESGALVLSDDVHCDLTRPGGPPYRPLGAVVPELWETGRLVACYSPGKTFTTAGLEAAAIMVPDPLGCALEEAKRLVGLHNPNYFAPVAAIAGWRHGQTWLDRVRAELDEHLDVAVDLLRDLLPECAVARPEGTYLVWVDARAYLRSESELEAACRRARVAVSPGEDFGASWAGWFRINVALPRTQLVTGLTRLCREIACPAPRTDD